MSRACFAIMAAVLAASAGFAQECPAPPADDSIDFGAPESLEVISDDATHTFTVEIADTPAEQARGMMFRPEVAPDQGMLFVFPDTAPRGFWMRNTCASLDILYLRADGTIGSMVRNAVPFSERSLPSGGPARAVLEIAGGRAEELGIKPGDRVVTPRLEAGEG